MNLDHHVPTTPSERFSRIAMAFPQRPAVDHDGQMVSYGQLDAWARSIRAALSQYQPADRAIVAILAEDRAASIAAILAVAGTRHAYVCLDPGDPEQRLQLILEDSTPFAVLADSAHSRRARALTNKGEAVIDVGALSQTAVAETPDSTAPEPDDLLYLFYTSGSTGQPKGVRQTHRNLMFFADAYAATLGISSDDRLSLLYTLSFSAANMDIYGALLNGATICPRDVRRHGVADLGDWIDGARITVLHAVPTVLRELCRALGDGRVLRSVRAVDLGGEAVTAADVLSLREHVLDGCLIVNHLAATEASVIAQYAVPAGIERSNGIMPVGYSPQGLEVHILRPDGSEAAAGETGTMAIDSPYLSPGYWQRPELDQACFSEIHGRPGWRRYIGGDLGRIDTLGLLHFIGRESSRIKLRGQSVDLNEVEAALRACEGVRDAAVVPRGPAHQEFDRLVACVVLAEGMRGEPAHFRRMLAQRLPSYMLPGGYCFIDRLPSSPTGKLDRQALQQYDLDALLYRPDYHPPASDTELTIAGIYERVLNYAPIGRSDDFFLLGGDSLTLQALQLEAMQHFGREFPGLHEDASVAALACRMDASEGSFGSNRELIVGLRAGGSAPPLFLVHGRLGQAHVSPRFVDLLGPDQPLFAIQARGLDGLGSPNETIEAMAEDYIAALRAIRPAGPYLIGSLCAGAYVALSMARSLRATGDEVMPLLLIDPPIKPARRGDRTLAKERVLRKLRKRAAQQKIVLALDDEQAIDGSVAVAQAFEQALRNHEPIAYDGPSFVHSSRHRLGVEHWGDPAKRNRVFAQPPVWLPAGESHSDMLDPANEEFARNLRHCLNWIRQGATPIDLTGVVVHEFPQAPYRNRWWRRLRGMFGV